MKRKLFVLIFGLLGIFLASQACAGTNLLLNPGFEEGFNDWTDTYYGGAFDLADGGHSGAYSLSNQPNSSIYSQAYWAQIYQDLDYTAGDPVYFAGYIKTTFPAQATAKAGFLVQFLDENGDPIAQTDIKSNEVGGTTDWTLCEASLQNVPSGTVTVRVNCYLWAAQGDTPSTQGMVYFDDLVLFKEYHQRQLPTTLVNPGFESGPTGWFELWGFPATIVSDVFHSGLYSAKKTIGDLQGKDYWTQLYQDIACGGGKKVTASIYLKTDFLMKKKAKAGLQVECMDTNNKVLKTQSASIGFTNWRNIVVTVKKTPNNTVKLRFSVFEYSPGTDRTSIGKSAYFDDATLSIQ